VKHFGVFVEPVEADVVIAQNALFADPRQVRYRERGGTPVTTAQPNIAGVLARSIPKAAQCGDLLTSRCAHQD